MRTHRPGFAEESTIAERLNEVIYELGLSLQTQSLKNYGFQLQKIVIK